MSQFESPSEINKGLDFTFDGKNMRPLKQMFNTKFCFLKSSCSIYFNDIYFSV